MSAVLQESFEPTQMPVTVELSQEAKREITATGSALAIAQSFEVDCVEMAQALADERRAWAAKIDMLSKWEAGALAPAKKALEEMKVWVANQFGAKRADYTAARELAGQKLLAWDQAEKARIAREQAEREALARKLRQEAEAKAAAEQAKAQAIAAEKRKKEQEALEAQRKAEAEGNARAAREAAARAAKAAEEANAAVENGNAKAQEVQLQAAAQVTAPVAEPVKIAGQAVKDNWVAELAAGLTEDDAKRLIAIAAVERPELLGLIKLDMTAVNRMAKALKGVMHVPGFTAANRPQLAGSRK